MIEVVESVRVESPPEEVFDIAADPGMLARWQGGMSDVHAEGDGKPGLGSRMTGVRRYAGVPMRWTSEVTEYEPPHRLAFRMVGALMRVLGLQEFRPDAGGTRVQVALRVEIRGLARLPLADRAERMIAEQLRADLQRLRALAESRP